MVKVERPQLAPIGFDDLDGRVWMCGWISELRSHTKDKQGFVRKGGSLGCTSRFSALNNTIVLALFAVLADVLARRKR
jgi:hypothetical protein